MNTISLHTGIKNTHFPHSKLHSCYVFYTHVNVLLSCTMWYITASIKKPDVIKKGNYWMCMWKHIYSNNQYGRWLLLQSQKRNRTSNVGYRIYWTFLMKTSYDIQKVLLFSFSCSHISFWQELIQAWVFRLIVTV